MICNEYVGMYFYSAVLQGNMALLALLGVFVVFKRQELTIDLQGKDNAIVSYVQNYLDMFSPISKHVAINYPNVEGIPTELLNMSNDEKVHGTTRTQAKDLYDDSNFKARYAERKELVDRRAKIVSLMAPAFIWILSIIIVSLVLLPFVHSIHAKTPWLELLLIVATIISNIWALIVTKGFVWTMLTD